MKDYKTDENIPFKTLEYKSFKSKAWPIIFQR